MEAILSWLSFAGDFSGVSKLITAHMTASLCMMCASTAWAQDPESQEPVKVVRSAHFYRLSEESVSGDFVAGAVTPGVRGVRSYLVNHSGLFELPPDSQIKARVLAQPRYIEELELARGMRDLGLERFRELRAVEAIEYLTRARSAYLRVRHDLIAPQEVSEVLFYLALSYLEQGEDAAQSLGVLREMVLLDPAREMLPGYFPENVVNAYRLARRGIMQELERRGLPLELDGVARSLATLMEADYVVLGFLVPSSKGGGDVARLFVWSAASGKVEFAEEQIVTSPEDAVAVEDAFNRMSARWADCLKEPPEQVDGQGSVGPIKPRDDGYKLGLDLALSYGTYLGFPRLRPELGPAPPGTIAHFGNLGVSIGGQWMFRDELAAISRVQLWVSQREHSGLIDARDVTALRGFAGVELGFTLGRFKPGMQLAMEFAHVSDFSILGEISCVPQPRTGECAPELSSEFYDDHNLMIGLNLAPMLSWRINRKFDLIGKTSISYYLFSTTEGEEINLPWGGELGVRYKF